MLDLLKLAAEYSDYNHRRERIFLVGAVGVRNDGRVVHSRNEAVYDSHNREAKNGSVFCVYKRFPDSHAEARLTRKLGFGATVYVARVLRGTKELAMSRPCECCQNILRAFKTKKVYYTISNNEWGMWDVAKNTDMVYGKK